MAVPSSRCVLSRICLNTRTGSPLSPLSNGKPIWGWQAEVWLTALCENLRARNGYIERLKAWMTFLSTSGTQLPRSTMVYHYVAKSFLDFAEALRSRPLSLVSVAQQSHRQQTDTAPLKHAAWFEDLTLCTRILPDRNTWTFSLPCLSESLVEMQSVAKSWTLSPHVKLQVVSIWKKHGDLRMWCHPSCSYRGRYTAEAMGQFRKGWNGCALLSIESTDYHICPFLLAGSEVQHLRPSLVLSLQHVLSKHSCVQTIRL